jgi:hypothetical protein
MARQVSFGGGLVEAPEPRYIRQRAMADALLGQNRPQISGWGEGVANLARTAAAGFINKRADEAETTATKARADALRAALSSPDPLAALSQSDAPDLQSMSLQWQMANAMKGPEALELKEVFNPETGQMEYVKEADAIGRPAAAPSAPELKAPPTRTRDVKGMTIQEEMQPDGTWKEIGARPTFAPTQGPAEPEKIRLAKAAGLVEGTKEWNDFLTGKTGSGADPFKQANTLRDEYNTLTKDFRTVQDAFAKIESTSPTGAGDMSMLYSYVKLLDPGSVVRESEFATAAASGSFGEQVQGAVQRLATGERLPDSLRDAFKAEAKSIFKAQKGNYERVRTLYSDIATRNQVNPQDVIPDYAAPEAVPAVDLGTGGANAPAPVMGGTPDSQGGNIIRYDATGKRIP